MSRIRSQIREVINRNTVVNLALEQGFNVFLPVYDGGVDSVLYRESDGGGAYSRPRPSASVIAKCAPYRFAPISEVAADAAAEEPE